MKARWTGAATTMSCPAEVATLLYSSNRTIFQQCPLSKNTDQRGDSKMFKSTFSSHSNCSNRFGLLRLVTYSSCTITSTEQHLQKQKKAKKKKSKRQAVMQLLFLTWMGIKNSQLNEFTPTHTRGLCVLYLCVREKATDNGAKLRLI